LSLILEDVVEFLRDVPPFQFLDERTLTSVARDVSLEFYPKGTLILKQDGNPSQHLSIIKKGGVRIYLVTGEGEEMVIDYRGEGDCFGFLSIIGGDHSRSNVVSVDDTVCYQLGREAVLRLLESNPSFTEFFLKTVLIKYIDKTYKEVQDRSLLYGGGDKVLFTTPVGELAVKKAVSKSQDISVQEAARAMSFNNISSLILTDEDGMPVGIVTDRDLRGKVVARARAFDSPVKDIMSRSLVKVDAMDYCFEALLKMIRYGIHHLIVVESGRVKGVVTNHDFMLLQGTSPVSVVRDIEGRQTVEELASAAGRINKIVALLLKEGARAGNITRIITEINDRLVRQAIEIVSRKHGPAPLPYCWVCLGSEGRKEQTFKTDQDNALIYADPASKEEQDAAEKYFASFTADVNDALTACGFPACTAGYMASNERWRLPLKGWKKLFRDWIYDPTPEAVLSSLIFFDFRAVHGDISLAEALRDALFSMLKDQGVFLGFMANTIIKNRPPIGFFKQFVVEKGGEHKDELDLKVKGLSPLVDIARLFALENGVRETSTVERLHALKERHSIVDEYSDELEHAFEFIMLQRIHRQMGRMEQGLLPENFINPESMSGLEKRMMKESFNLITKVQDLVIEKYKPMIW